MINSKELIAIIIAVIAEKNAELAKKIIKSLPQEESNDVVNILQENNLFNEEQVNSALQQFHKLAIEKSSIIISDELNDSLESLMVITNEKSKEIKQTLHNIKDEKYINFMEKEGEYSAVMLCHLLGSEKVATLLSKKEDNEINQIIKTYLNSTPYSEYIKNSMTQFLLNELSDQKDNKKIDTSKICEVVESLSESTIDFIQAQNDPDLKPVLESMVKIEDIEEYDDMKLSNFLNYFSDPKELVVLQSYIPENIQFLLWNKLTDRLKAIVEEESQHYEINEDDQIKSKQKALKIIRKIKKEGVI